MFKTITPGGIQSQLSGGKLTLLVNMHGFITNVFWLLEGQERTNNGQVKIITKQIAFTKDNLM